MSESTKGIAGVRAHDECFEREGILGKLSTKQLLSSAAVLLISFTLMATVSRAEQPLSPRYEENTMHCSQSEHPSTEQIVAHMVSNNESRSDALRGYTGRRVYHLEYHGFPSSRDAELIVEARYKAPATKEFTVVSQKGSRLLIERVLKGLLTTEEEAQNPQNRQQTALTPQNYNFQLACEQVTDQGHFYILNVQPKTPNKFLYRGKIWIDANDFAIARIEAEPAQNPSFWINHTKIEQRYAKIGPFWLPVRNESTSKVRLGGTATLTIEYQDYRISGDSDGKTQAAMNDTGKAF